jgi:5-methylthioadenosine/S-adenosylhomocysteine deaminase
MIRASILVKDDRISEIGNREGIWKSLYPSAEVIDARDRILLPGFIEPHYHGESFLLRQFTQTMPMAQWTKDHLAQNAMKYIRTQATHDELSAMYRAGYFSALKSGVTTLAEYGCDNLDVSFSAAYEAMKRADLRGYIGLHNGDQIEKAHSLPSGTIRYSMVLPPEEALTTYNIQTTMRVAREMEIPVDVHSGETLRSSDVLKKNFGKPLIEMLMDLRLMDQALRFIHCSCLDEAERNLVAQRALRLIIAPKAILTKGVDVPPLEAFGASGIRLALCSDWGASDPFENMRALFYLFRAQSLKEPDGHALLSMHTREAADALGISEEVGTLAHGKKADIVFLDSSDIRMIDTRSEKGIARSLTDLVLHTSGRDVSDVMINGEFFLRQQQILTYSEDDIKRESASVMTRLLDVSASLVVKASPIRMHPEESVEESEDEGDLGGRDEGFRVLSKNPPEQGKILPLPPKNKGIELPKTTRRVFGEDD